MFFSSGNFDYTVRRKNLLGESQIEGIEMPIYSPMNFTHVLCTPSSFKVLFHFTENTSSAFILARTIDSFPVPLEMFSMNAS